MSSVERPWLKEVPIVKVKRSIDTRNNSFCTMCRLCGLVPKGMLAQGTLVVSESCGDLRDSVLLGPSRVLAWGTDCFV